MFFVFCFLPAFTTKICASSILERNENMTISRLTIIYKFFFEKLLNWFNTLVVIQIFAQITDRIIYFKFFITIIQFVLLVGVFHNVIHLKLNWKNLTKSFKSLRTNYLKYFKNTTKIAKIMSELSKNLHILDIIEINDSLY